MRFLIRMICRPVDASPFLARIFGAPPLRWQGVDPPQITLVASWDPHNRIERGPKAGAAPFRPQKPPRWRAREISAPKAGRCQAPLREAFFARKSPIFRQISGAMSPVGLRPCPPLVFFRIRGTIPRRRALASGGVISCTCAWRYLWRFLISAFSWWLIFQRLRATSHRRSSAVVLQSWSRCSRGESDEPSMCFHTHSHSPTMPFFIQKPFHSFYNHPSFFGRRFICERVPRFSVDVKILHLRHVDALIYDLGCRNHSICFINVCFLFSFVFATCQAFLAKSSNFRRASCLYLVQRLLYFIFTLSASRFKVDPSTSLSYFDLNIPRRCPTIISNRNYQFWYIFIHSIDQLSKLNRIL